MSGKIILDDQKKLILKANNKILIQKYLLVKIKINTHPTSSNQ